MSIDRPSLTRILVTVAVVIAVAGALLLAAWAVLGWLVPRPTGISGVAPLFAPAVADAAGTPVIVIDAGHSGRADMRQEPIGPGSSVTKPRDAGGTSGVATRNPESLINLQVALRLRRLLVARGMKVVMVRTTQAKSLSSSERARIANANHATLFVRLHCDGSTNRSRTGISMLVPKRNRWTGPIYTPSRRAGRLALASTVRATGARNLGLVERSDLSGFNWSSVPSFLIEMGFMSNPAEDRKLATPSYQQKLATGIANGVAAYVAGK